MDINMYGSHFSHIFWETSISLKKLKVLIEEPSISIEKPNILMFNSDFDQKANFFKLENQVFQSIYRSSAQKSHIFITNLILTIDREATCLQPSVKYIGKIVQVQKKL